MKIFSLILGLGVALTGRAAELFVAPKGNDGNPGTWEQPLATLQQAQQLARQTKATIITLRGGLYYLPTPLVLRAEDSGVIWRAAAGAKPVISGGFELTGLNWEPHQNGIFKTRLSNSSNPASGIGFNQLFVNGERMPMARYPNFDPQQRIFNGYAADAISDARVAKWSDPADGFFHAMHKAMWGGMHYRITGKDAQGKLQMEGGWQNNRPSAPHKECRFVENIFEEIDAPGEWFFNAKTATLYFLPPAGLDLRTAKLEGARLCSLVEFQGSEQQPVRNVTLAGLTFRHAARTFMDNKEPMLRTDWTVYRGGAIFFNGAVDCHMQDCLVEQVGGNAVFVNNFNRGLVLRACQIAKAGANGIAFVGDPQAVRNPLVGYEKRMNFADVDRTSGPKSNNYPADCLVEDCLIHETGRVEKQTAGVEIDMAMNITVRHCSIYDMPRAGINIGDGCWGGHIIEFCDVFDTVKETGDHGSFNSWGRDRYWGLQGIDLGTVTLGENKNLPVLDVCHTNILRNTRWRCDHGWDIDLDDGSTLYEIRNNLCLHGGLKNREGFYRVVENNIIVNNSFHPHVWYGNSKDIFSRNIVCTPYRPVMKAPWGLGAREIDFNLVHQNGAVAQPAAILQQSSGRDAHSLIADALFMDPAKGDYRVKEGSPALKLGFQNFPMDQFGVRSPKLKAIAKTPELPVPGVMKEEKSKRDAQPNTWLGAKIKNVVGLGEVSAAGLPGEMGVALVAVPPDSAAAKAGLKERDVILKCAGRSADTVKQLLRVWSTAAKGDRLKFEIWRDQKAASVEIATDAQPIKRTPVANTKVVIEARNNEAFEALPRASLQDAAHGCAVSTEPGTANEKPATLTDGKLATNYGPVFPNGVTDGKYRLDLGTVKIIAQVNTYSFNQGGRRGRQIFELYGSAAADPGFDVAAPAYTLLAVVDTTGKDNGKFVGTSIQTAQGDSLGKFRWLVWVVSPVNEAPGENTAYHEFDVAVTPVP
jgi:hypothetical protein